MINLWQNLPYYINPVIVEIGFFQVRWYWVMYLVALSTVYGLLFYRFRKDKVKINKDRVEELVFWMFLGALLGARLGYAFFYDSAEFIENPLSLFNPFLKTQAGWEFQGISGLSYHGGLLGAVLAALIFLKINRLNLLTTIEFILPAVPLGYFWGRIGNFLNGELYGRITEASWGMYFPAAYQRDGQSFLRHPSQLYEAFFEGIILFVILWSLRNKHCRPGFMAAIYLAGYGLVRFFIEFFREPDPQLGFVFGFLTMGQILCLAMILAALVILGLSKNKNEKRSQ